MWLGGVVALALFAGFVITEYRLNATPASQASSLILPADEASLAEGQRLAVTRGCLGCHGEDGAGQVFFDEPFMATIVAPNLTTAFRRRSLDELDAAIRHGTGFDGRALVIMPSNMYRYLSDDNTAKIIAYIDTLPEVQNDLPRRSIGPLARLFFLTGTFKTAPELIAGAPLPAHDPATEPVLAKGEYVAMTMCTECHGPDLKGSAEDPEFVTPDLTIAAAYQEENFKTLMKTGEAAGGRDLGLMSEVARGRFAHLTDEEIAALHAFLQARADTIIEREGAE